MQRYPAWEIIDVIGEKLNIQTTYLRSMADRFESVKDESRLRMVTVVDYFLQLFRASRRALR